MLLVQLQILVNLSVACLTLLFWIKFADSMRPRIQGSGVIVRKDILFFVVSPAFKLSLVLIQLWYSEGRFKGGEPRLGFLTMVAL